MSFHWGSKQWLAYIKEGGKVVKLGYFQSEKEAARKYDEAAATLGQPQNFAAPKETTTPKITALAQELIPAAQAAKPSPPLPLLRANGEAIQKVEDAVQTLDDTKIISAMPFLEPLGPFTPRERLLLQQAFLKGLKDGE